MSVNWRKSCLVGINILPHQFSEIANTLHCPIRSFPIDYLGVPLGGNLAKKRNFGLQLLKDARRNRPWKAKSLSFGGRIILIKAALSNLPIYYLSIFKIPIRIARQIETLQRKFLWRGNSDLKPHLISGLQWRALKIMEVWVLDLFHKRIRLFLEWRFPQELNLL